MPYTVTHTSLSEVLILTPEVFEDERGFFLESFNQRAFSAVVGRDVAFVQDNHSRSIQGVLRGLHYQVRHAQGKLIRVVQGEVFDVAVDIRSNSPDFGKWAGVTLSSRNKRQLWIPPGFAHGFLVTSESAELIYKITDYWRLEYERSLAWNDPDLGICWPIHGEPILSAKDAVAENLRNIELPNIDYLPDAR